MTELAGTLAARRVSSLELTRACLARIAKLNDALNAFITVDEERAIEEAKRADTRISDEAAQFLLRHSWPGNVRELRHAIERACGMAGPFSNLLNEEAFEFLLGCELDLRRLRT